MASTLAAPAIPDTLPTPDRIDVSAAMRAVRVRWTIPTGDSRHVVDMLSTHDKQTHELTTVLERTTYTEQAGSLTVAGRLDPADVHYEHCLRYSAKRLHAHAEAALDALGVLYANHHDQLMEFFTPHAAQDAA